MTRQVFTDAMSAVKTREPLGNSLAERLQQATTPAQGTPKRPQDSRHPTEPLGVSPSASPDGTPPSDALARSEREALAAAGEPSRADLIAAGVLADENGEFRPLTPAQNPFAGPRHSSWAEGKASVRAGVERALVTTLPSCDVCGSRARDEARFIAGRLLCLPCWRWIARARGGETPAKAGTPRQLELVKQTTTKED